ncbi:hypothetical protein [Brachybacterium sacelli]|uniref:Uncharacterized protein n=1 Tax=Brachybacterium sacelli TaxID=173364 RepID=A0ABS4X5K2_9MICO|nr:hypothetical protein [Brachybacterium sacelli]MBP2383742.1 hypothetical protein [Brachybacterium sacelli]
MTGRRRGVRLHRTPWGTAAWFLASPASIAALILVALAVLITALATTKPWEALVEERTVYVPVPVIVTVEPDESDHPDAPTPTVPETP